MTDTRLPVLFVSHGGGPWPYVEELRRQYPRTERELRGLSARLATQPKAVVVVSGHWEAPRFSVATGAKPPMEYDYGGFPAHTYKIHYDAPGDPPLAREVLGLLSAAGIDAAADADKGFDHGVFVPLELMFPRADMPIVMVSIKSDYNAAEHLALGRALAPLREQDVLIVASGLNYHNMRGFGRDGATQDAEVFTRYLDEAVALEDAALRAERFARWEHAPRARLAHPREDHLMPLLAAVGAAGGDKGRVLLNESVMRIPMTSYVFGELKPAMAQEASAA
jgi:aromatic ring-opening dioxygenase catalytic subunit (LigB family)